MTSQIAWSTGICVEEFPVNVIVDLRWISEFDRAVFLARKGLRSTAPVCRGRCAGQDAATFA